MTETTGWRRFFGAGGIVPKRTPGETLTPEALARVTPEEMADLMDRGARYVRSVDMTRSRKRYDDCSGDVGQDAILHFASRLTDMIETRAPLSTSVETRETDSWEYVRRDGTFLRVTRRMLLKWAVSDSAIGYGLRTDVAPEEADATPYGRQPDSGTGPEAYAEHGISRQARANADGMARTDVTIRSTRAAMVAEVVWRTAYGDGSDFPTLRAIRAEEARGEYTRVDSIPARVAKRKGKGTRAGIGAVRADGARELRELMSRCDAVRADLIRPGE